MVIFLNLLTDNSSSGFASIDEEFTPIFFRSRVVCDGDVHVVEDVVRIRLVVVLRDDTGVLLVAILIHVTTHGKSAGAILLVSLHWVTPSHLKNINNLQFTVKYQAYQVLKLNLDMQQGDYLRVTSHPF